MNNECCNHQANETISAEAFHWHDVAVWKQSAHNTLWCLLGCSLGDFATILWFQTYSPTTSTWLVMTLAIVNGILSSITLETVLMQKQMGWKKAFFTAIGMSLISMVSMEAAMNIVDIGLIGTARLTWWTIPPMLLAGFLTPWPYNYWRLKKLGRACH